MKVIGKYINKEKNRTYDVLYDQKNNRYYLKDKYIMVLATKEDLQLAKVTHNIYNRVVKHKRKKNAVATVLILACLGLSSIGLIETLNDHKQHIEYLIDDNNVDLYDLLTESLLKNETVNNDQMDIMGTFITKLITIKGIKPYKAISMAHSLEIYDFNTVKTLDDYKTVLNTILSTQDYGFIATELFNSVYGEDESYKLNCLANLFYNDDTIATRLINGESLFDILKKDYNCLGNDKELFRIWLDHKSIILDREVNKYLVQSLYGKPFKTDLEKRIASSSFLDGLYGMHSNIFNDVVKITDKSSHDMYYSKSGSDISSLYYDEWLNKILNESTYDYSNRDNRFALYFKESVKLANLIADTEIGQKLEEEKPSEFIDVISINDFEEYYNDTYNYYTVSELHALAYFGDYTYADICDIRCCLYKEMLEGRVTENIYNSFVNRVSFVYELYYPYMVNSWRLINYSTLEDDNKKSL